MSFAEKIRLYFITDGRSHGHERVAEMALKAGVKTIQLREKRLPAREIYGIAKRLRRLTYDYEALFIVNDRFDIAISVEADGIHVGQEDLPAKAIRSLIDEKFPGMILGVSARDLSEALEAEKYADYLGVGPVFPTSTKEDAREVIGIDGLKKVCSAVKVPVVAIGGINHSNVSEVLKAGCTGVAVISAIAFSENPEKSAEELLNLIENSNKPHKPVNR
ncbi:thiamine-phosphate diphosphorylase [Archaeoglobus sulfaticallidus PM70-1]|uniref:Thiamine-phosphate synthase n=1 Tax=Archaeoglobus sulfaticallidus PM70-1 TaxID=387631 RepID=N0BAV0_9EURY|nr:thiamine phosphate synthase [Archaeoglobus sulfaticallidus]AGK60734.1 thiamine-phosphate diphosphorylase [Archaeoglobus sulfaticallidus PM70-1]